MQSNISKMNVLPDSALLYNFNVVICSAFLSIKLDIDLAKLQIFMVELPGASRDRFMP